MDFSHIPFPCLSLRFLIKNYCAVWILHSSLFHFSPSPNNQTKESLIFTFLSFFFTPSVSWKKRGICRKMRNFTFIKKSCARIKMATFQEVKRVDLSFNFVGLHGRGIFTFINISLCLLHLTFE